MRMVNLEQSRKSGSEEQGMRRIFVEKVVFNIGTGTDQKTLERAIALIEYITGVNPVKTFATKRIPTWGVRPGIPLGCKLTLRGGKALELIPKLLGAKDNKLPESCFDNHGNVSFGVPEYIELPGVKYNPDIGMMGFQVTIKLARPGLRVAKRRVKKAKPGKKQLVTKEEAINYFKQHYNVEVVS